MVKRASVKEKKIKFHNQLTSYCGSKRRLNGLIGIIEEEGLFTIHSTKKGISGIA
jgi:hypothetical protein